MRTRLVGAAVIATAALMLSLVSPALATFKEKTLYQRLGGLPAITAVVNDFVGNVAADKRINAFFAKTNIPRLKRNLVNQLCQGTGGPCKYTGRNMKDAHRGMGVGGMDFAALVEDLQKSLNTFKVPAREQDELIAILAPMRKDIVEKR